MKRAVLTAACVLFGCAGEKDPMLESGTTGASSTAGEPTSGGTSSPTGGEETGFEPTAGAGPFEPKILYVAGGAGPEGRASWMNPDGSDPMQVGSGMTAENTVRWTRSGANVLLNRAGDIWRVTPETGDEFNITSTPDEYSNLLDSSPDGSWVLFSGSRGNVRGMYRVRITGGTAQPLVTSDVPTDVRYAARYSPDGQKIAFIVNEMGVEPRLFISDDLGMDALAVPGIVAHETPTWSPDGTRLAVTGTVGADNGIFTLTAAGTGLKRITSGMNATYARWSPDGSRIAFYGSVPDHGSGWVLGVIDADGANERFLTQDYDTCYLPDWSPDGASLVFGCSDETDGQGVFTMVVDGGTPTMILSEPNNSWYPQWRP